MTATGFDDSVSLEFGRTLVRSAAPEELPFYDELVSTRSESQQRKESALGFGADDMETVTLSAALLGIGKCVVCFLWEHGRDAAGALVKEASGQIAAHLGSKLKKWLSKPTKTSPPPVTITSVEAARLINILRKENLLVDNEDQNAAVIRQIFALVPGNDRQS